MYSLDKEVMIRSSQMTRQLLILIGWFQMFTQVWRQEYMVTSRRSFMDIFENLVKVSHVWMFV